MKLSIGIVGLPNVGKSTLFKLLTKQEVNIANYPFATIDPNVGIVPVPDERLKMIDALSKSQKIIPAAIEFYDIAGLVKGAYKGEGLGNQFLSHIREVNGIVVVVRCFPSDEIIHVEGSVDPVRDIDTVHTELILKDLDTLAKRLSTLEAEARTGGKKKNRDLEVLKKVQNTLNRNEPASHLGAEILVEPVVRELNLLTAKPPLYLFNGTESNVTDALKAKVRGRGSEYLVMDLTAAQALDPLITMAYRVLGLASFFTTGQDETRAWTIASGTKAPQAAGVIHSDFEEKFIRAEVIPTQKLLEAGSWQKAKQKGWIRVEGKEYVVQDGDVIVVKHG